MYMLNYKNTCQRRTPLTQKLYDTLTGIQWGTVEDAHSWTVPVG